MNQKNRSRKKENKRRIERSQNFKGKNRRRYGSKSRVGWLPYLYKIYRKKKEKKKKAFFSSFSVFFLVSCFFFSFSTSHKFSLIIISLRALLLILTVRL